MLAGFRSMSYSHSTHSPPPLTLEAVEVSLVLEPLTVVQALEMFIITVDKTALAEVILD